MEVMGGMVVYRYRVVFCWQINDEATFGSMHERVRYAWKVRDTLSGRDIRISINKDIANQR